MLNRSKTGVDSHHLRREVLSQSGLRAEGKEEEKKQKQKHNSTEVDRKINVTLVRITFLIYLKALEQPCKKPQHANPLLTVPLIRVDFFFTFPKTRLRF